MNCSCTAVLFTSFDPSYLNLSFIDNILVYSTDRCLRVVKLHGSEISIYVQL